MRVLVFCKRLNSFYRKKELITIHLPITTGSISSPMERGSDSSPIKVNLGGSGNLSSRFYAVYVGIWVSALF